MTFFPYKSMGPWRLRFGHDVFFQTRSLFRAAHCDEQNVPVKGGFNAEKLCAERHAKFFKLNRCRADVWFLPSAKSAMDTRVQQRIRLYLRGEEAMGLSSLPIRVTAPAAAPAAAARTQAAATQRSAPPPAPAPRPAPPS